MYVILCFSLEILYTLLEKQWPKEEGHTIQQWPKEEGQTIQWPKEGQTIQQWPKEGDNTTMAKRRTDNSRVKLCECSSS
jgi:hypothetical protein